MSSGAEWTTIQKYVGDLKEAEFLGVHHEMPNLILNPDKTDFYDMTIQDFTIEHYEPIKPNLKLELGI